MIGPVFVYYQLRNFYQNHRLYAKSVSTEQLQGNSRTDSQLQSECEPIVYNRDLYTNTSITGDLLEADSPANPCGMIAFTYFNDSFVLKNQGGNEVNISNVGIAWPTDLQKYKMPNPNISWINVTDERFMNWMRIAAMPNFRKLWGRVEDNLPAGNYTLNITNCNIFS